MATQPTVQSSQTSDGISSITGETLRKAIEELNENPTTRTSMIRELRDRISVREAELGVSVNYYVSSQI